MRLRCGELPVLRRGDLLAFVPHPPGRRALAPGWLEALCPHGLAVLEIPSDPLRATTLRATLRMQEIDVVLLDRDDEPLCRGRVDLAYFWPPAGAASRHRAPALGGGDGETGGLRRGRRALGRAGY